ncbi:hypothetical protein HJFPF1_02580 [Paramyrothecium foliicola]|nr:hypothetical protein HJFPF1_02580 [Paramyrothecium foliicola]
MSQYSAQLTNKPRLAEAFDGGRHERSPYGPSAALTSGASKPTSDFGGCSERLLNSATFDSSWLMLGVILPLQTHTPRPVAQPSIAFKPLYPFPPSPPHPCPSQVSTCPPQDSHRSSALYSSDLPQTTTTIPQHNIYQHTSTPTYVDKLQPAQAIKLASPQLPSTPVVIIENRVVNRRRSNPNNRERRLSLPHSSTRPTRPTPIVTQEHPPVVRTTTAAPHLSHSDTMCNKKYIEDRGLVFAETRPCRNALAGRPCNDKPSGYNRPYGTSPPVISYPDSQLPPTPSYTPRSGTPNHRSGDESDRSGSPRRSKRHSGISISINGKPVDWDQGERRRSRDRVAFVDSPITPPQTYAAPLTPPSPSRPFIVSPPAPRDSPRRYHIVETPHVEIVSPKRHTRHASTSSHESRHSRHSSKSDEEDRQRRHVRSTKEERELRKAKVELEKQYRIKMQNDKINRRDILPPPVEHYSPPPRVERHESLPKAPQPPPPTRHSASQVRRPSVTVHNNFDDLAESVRRMHIQPTDPEYKERLRDRFELKPRRHGPAYHGEF